MSRAVHEVGQRRRLTAAVGVKLGVAGEQRDQTVEVAVGRCLNESREQVGPLPSRRCEPRPCRGQVLPGSPQNLPAVRFRSRPTAAEISAYS